MCFQVADCLLLYMYVHIKQDIFTNIALYTMIKANKCCAYVRTHVAKCWFYARLGGMSTLTIKIISSRLETYMSLATQVARMKIGSSYIDKFKYTSRS